MTILLEAGFAKDEAARAFRLLFVYSFGFAALSPAGVEEESRAGARAALVALSPDEYPTLAEWSRRPRRPWGATPCSSTAST